MNRGSAEAQRSGRQEAGPFNEAPIHESGKWPSGSSSRPNPNPFNEAPIHESGKFSRLRIIRYTKRGPSMRPRFMNRGSAMHS